MSGSSATLSRLFISLGVGASVAIAAGICFRYIKVYKGNLIPKKWRRIGTLEHFCLYPVKSLAPIKLEDGTEIDCELLGMKFHGVFDRSLMLVDLNDQVVTARTYPKMVIIKTEIIGEGILRLTAPESESELPPLEIDLNEIRKGETKRKIISTTIWGSRLNVLHCNETFDQWFSLAILGRSTGLRLAYYHHTAPVRAIIDVFSHEAFITRNDTGTLGDGTSYMLMNLASIDDLNRRLPKPVSPIQFRGNFYLKMDQNEPYAEDNWNWIKIGEDAIFRIVAPCTRCIVPNVNHTLGERDPEGEPLRTLKTYRKSKYYKSPPLGSHMGLRQRGTVHLHDIIYVEDH